MSPIDALTNAFTASGFAALLTDALELDATASDATDTNGVLGEQAAGPDVFSVSEPGPVEDQPQGDNLTLRNVGRSRLGNDAVSSRQPVQGFLANCPLVAVLVAMAHVPAFRESFRRGAIVQRTARNFSTFRERESWEFADPPQTLPRLPSKDANFTGDHVFTVNFFSGPQTGLLGKRGQFDVLRFGSTVTETVTPVLWIQVDIDSVFFARTASPAIWVEIIEKAFISRHDPGGRNAYEALEGSITPIVTMFEMCGFARQGQITNAEVIVEPDPETGSTDISDALTQNELSGMLRRHATRPTVLGSLESPGSAEIVGNHTYAVTGFDPKTGVVELVNALEEPTAPTREVSISLAELGASFGEIIQGPAQRGVAPV